MSRPAAPHIITLLDDVEKVEKEVVEAMLAIPDRRPLRMVINSGGGSVYASLGMATVIKMKQFQSEAVVLADCSSSAILVFAACQVRKVAPHASFLFHPMRWSSEDASRLPGAKSWAAEFNRVSQVCEDWLVTNLGVPRKVLRTWIKEERYIQAHELFDLGVAEPLDLGEARVIDVTRTRRAAASASRSTASRPAARRPAVVKPVKLRRAG